MIDYKSIENQLLRLLYLLDDVFSDSEIIEVQEFIDAGEYGLALDTLLDIIDEESKLIPQEVVGLAKHIAVAMELDGSVVEEKCPRSNQ